MSVVTTIWLISVIALIVSAIIERVANPYRLPGRIFRAISKVACVISIISTFIIVCFWIASFKP